MIDGGQEQIFDLWLVILFIVVAIVSSVSINLQYFSQSVDPHSLLHS